MTKEQERFQEIVNKYDKTDLKLVKDTVDMLAAKGVGNGCYQDYGVLSDVLEVLSVFESAIKNKED